MDKAGKLLKNMGLGGLTPARAADVPVDLGRNKMLSLIRKPRDKT